jgi:tetratricopeptide (TPR) repeat protein
MRSTVLALLLVAAPLALAGPPPEAGAQPEVAERPARNGGVASSPPGPPPPAAAAAVAPPAAPPAAPAPPSRALIEKLGAGDRAFLIGDYRTALFAYQDAGYLDPTSAVARVKLARAYAALGHRDQAERQLRQALELDPANDEARKLLEEPANPPRGAASPAAAATALVAPLVVAPAPTAPPRSYRITDDVGAPPPDPGRAGAGLVLGAGATAVGPVPAAPSVGADPQEASRHYKTALGMIGARDFNGAIVELDRALEINPQLGVAVAARASAFYGLGRYPEAARDYEAALALVPHLATPLYGLAESYRRLGDPRAAEYYLRYAQSEASDVRPELRETARQRAEQLGGR